MLTLYRNNNNFVKKMSLHYRSLFVGEPNHGQQGISNWYDLPKSRVFFVRRERIRNPWHGKMSYTKCEKTFKENLAYVYILILFYLYKHIYIYITEIKQIKQIGKYLNSFDIKIYISKKIKIPRTTVFKLQWFRAFAITMPCIISEWRICKCFLSQCLLSVVSDTKHWITKAWGRDLNL